MVYPKSKIFIGPIYRLWLGEVQGIENIPKDRPFIIAANHASYYDALLLHSIVIPKIDKKVHAMVNSTYWNNNIVGYILDWGKCIPLDVSGHSRNDNKKAFEEAFESLKKGDPVQIFPEGKRSQDGKLNKAYIGVAKLALKAKVPVVPMGIIDSFKVLPKGKFFPRFKRCKVKIGKPIYFKNYYNKKIDNKLLVGVTRKVMKIIAGLISQEYKY